MAARKAASTERMLTAPDRYVLSSTSSSISMSAWITKKYTNLGTPRFQ